MFHSSETLCSQRIKGIFCLNLMTSKEKKNPAFWVFSPFFSHIMSRSGCCKRKLNRTAVFLSVFLSAEPLSEFLCLPLHRVTADIRTAFINSASSKVKRLNLPLLFPFQLLHYSLFFLLACLPPQPPALPPSCVPALRLPLPVPNTLCWISSSSVFSAQITYEGRPLSPSTPHPRLSPFFLF